jgi:DNA (cytosine-5)-methyltransferase 1
LYKINGEIRKLSPRECARISGFPDSFVIHPKESESYKQFGNTVIVDVIQHILLEIIKTRIFESAETQNKPVKKIPATSNLI